MSLYNLLELVERFLRAWKYWENFLIFISYFRSVGARFYAGRIMAQLPVSVHSQNMSWIHICWWSLSLSLAVKFLTFWDQYSTAQKYL